MTEESLQKTSEEPCPAKTCQFDEKKLTSPEPTKPKRGRPVGTTGTSYTMSPQAWNQRVLAPMKDGKQSKIMKEIIKRQELSPEQQEILEEEKMKIWKLFSTPAVLLIDEYANLKTIINAKMLKGDDPTGDQLLKASKLLLDIAKEVNKLTTVSADKKMEAFSKSFSSTKGDIVIDIEPEQAQNEESSGESETDSPADSEQTA